MKSGVGSALIDVGVRILSCAVGGRGVTVVCRNLGGRGLHRHIGGNSICVQRLVDMRLRTG